MLLKQKKVYYGWFVVAGAVLVAFGVAGGQFSFGVFLKPMTEDFGWSRGTLSLAFGTTFMISGLLRPLAGYLADRYSPKIAVLSGVAIMGCMLLVIPFIQNLAQLFVFFAIMSIGVTLGTGPILTKIVSAWFHTRRGLTLGLVGGASSVGAMVLVPGTSALLVLGDWKQAYWFLGIMLLALVLPLAYLLIRNRPDEVGLEPWSGSGSSTSPGTVSAIQRQSLFGRDATLREAVKTPLFLKLTLGYFV
jgi:sugar phosphate permease